MSHHGKGGRTWDIDGNNYVDYRLGYGPAILGYADDRVDAAARRGHGGGRGLRPVDRTRTDRGRPHRQDGAGRRTGALFQLGHRGGDGRPAPGPRLYRARTAICWSKAAITGLFDAAMWMSNMEDWDLGSNTDPELVPYGKGIPQTVKQLAHITPMNDFQRLEDMFKRHGDKLAAMLIEPIQGNCCSIMAQVEYVQLARELCDQYGVLLIIDEVKSGFRVGKGGIQGIMGVTPDITTFAKAVANGYPIAVVAGREEVMRIFRYGGAAMAAPIPPIRSVLPPPRNACASSTKPRRWKPWPTMAAT